MFSKVLHRSEQSISRKARELGLTKTHHSKPMLRKPPNTECSYCHKPIKRRPYELKEYKDFFCSQKCYTLWQSKTFRDKTAIHRWKSGTRKDINCFVRSSWEANIYRYLMFLKENKQIKDFQYEPDTFWFEKIKRGTRSYTPDFKVIENNGDIIYWEVKGWFDKKSKTRAKRMGKYYPNIKIRMIHSKEYRELAKQLKGIIKKWE
jgi:hypothetical protein